MKYFSKMTKGTKDPNKQNMVLMGRKTWESIPAKFRPLPDRLNVVLSSEAESPGEKFKGSIVVGSFEKALEEGKKHNVETIWVIGGHSLYKAALESDHIHRLHLTKVMKEFDCDTFFPNLDFSQFDEAIDPAVPKHVHEENGIQYKYEVYQKKIT